MRLPNYVLSKVKRAKVRVWFAPRSFTKRMNEMRDDGDPIFYGGWYWDRSDNRGRVIDFDTSGPFRSEAAAIRDAYTRLQLKHQDLGSLPRGSNRGKPNSLPRANLCLTPLFFTDLGQTMSNLWSTLVDLGITYV